MKPNRILFFTGLAVAALLVSGCNRINALRDQIGGGAASQAAPERPVYAVNTTAAVQGQIRDYLALSGDIIAGSTVDTYSDAAGKITRVFVSVGDRVGQGASIAEVDPSRPGMNYISSIVTAPVSGTVVALPATVGMTVSQAVPLARIAVGSALELRLYVAERFISKIALRQSCEISLDAYPGEVFRGTISELSPVVDPTSRTMEIRIAVQNPGSRLKAGMFAKVRVITETRNNIVKIPAAALAQRFGESYVFVVAPDPANPSYRIARRQVIVPGINIDGVLEVQQGLSPDDEIVIRGQTLLEDGVRINVIDRLAPLSAGN
jgi:multidrug efflux pump subunit AcrA (membrane-fusion protein)